MKRLFFTFALIFMASFAFAEKITFRTGEIAGNSPADQFFPLDHNMIGSPCAVTSVHKVEKDLWCVRLTAGKTSNGGTFPIEFEYYLKIGDTITLRRLGGSAGLGECVLRVTKIDWNWVEFEVK